MAKTDLHLSLYSGMSGVSFIGMLTVPQLQDNFAFNWVYEISLSLFVISTMMFGIFALVHVIALEDKNKLEETEKILQALDGDEHKKTAIELQKLQFAVNLTERKLESNSAQTVTKAAATIFLLAFSTLVFALGIQIFILSSIGACVLFYCFKKFMRSDKDEFLS